jgi:cell wall-associated NlpC family hydrolase
VLATADDYVGTPYKWGGESPRTGFDCSGFVQYVFARHDVDLPRTSRQQAKVGERVSTKLSALKPGDLVMFASNGKRIDHVGIYAGDDRIIHSSSSGGGVRYDNLHTTRGSWFVRHLVASRRVIADGRRLVNELTAALRARAPLDPPDHAPRP